MTDQHELMFKTIGEPYLREWSTTTFDENGNCPPFEEWEKHSVEVVIVETASLKKTEQQIESLTKELTETKLKLQNCYKWKISKRSTNQDQGGG
jgi:hypothetical protein